MKNHVRNNILIELNKLAPDQKSSESDAIRNQLKNILKKNNGTWVAFKNLKDEPSIDWLEVSTAITWAFAKVNGQQLDFYKNVKSFKKSIFGVLEPDLESGKAEKINLSEVEGVILPALGFDSEGVRLGRGQGYYDRALNDYAGKKIGVCFNVSFCEKLPQEAHDIRCQQVVTEHQIYHVTDSVRS